MGDGNKVTLELTQREALFLEETLRQAEGGTLPTGFSEDEDLAQEILNKLGH